MISIQSKFLVYEFFHLTKSLNPLMHTTNLLLIQIRIHRDIQIRSRSPGVTTLSPGSDQPMLTPCGNFHWITAVNPGHGLRHGHGCGHVRKRNIVCRNTYWHKLHVHVHSHVLVHVPTYVCCQSSASCVKYTAGHEKCFFALSVKFSVYYCVCLKQCCGSGMFIPDPDFSPSRIPDPKKHGEVKKNFF